MPAVLGKKGVEHLVEIPLSPDENEKLKQSAQQLKILMKK
jgi:malate/lactate dehydrogenase